MTEKTSAELEREAESVRSRMTETAETLQRKLSPGQLVDELGSYFRNSEGKVALDNLKAQVRDNPLPLAMIGAGFAWLFLGNGVGARKSGGAAQNPADTGRFGASGAEIWEGASGLDAPDAGPSVDGSFEGDFAEDSGRAFTDRIGSAYGATGAAASSAAGSVGEGIRNVGHSAGEAGRHASVQIREAGSRAQRMVSNTLEQEPLILGALGVAVGAAVGAMLPRTQTEEAYLAPYGEKVRESARDAVDRGVEKTRTAVSTALESEGMPDGGANPDRTYTKNTVREEHLDTAPGTRDDRYKAK